MEFSQAQIAALVLGYLRSEKLDRVSDQFLRSCPHFVGNKHIKMGKYLITRVAGMQLVDFLEEYASIYTIVQAKLDETEFYETRKKSTLVEQLLYLLEMDVRSIRSSTPITWEVEATPASALPGNDYTEENDFLEKTILEKRKSRSASPDYEEAIEVPETLTQSLLENHELHEKIAEAINSVRNVTEKNNRVADEKIRAGASKELEAVIKTVVQRTEEDPMYNKLIDEIIGTTTEAEMSKKSVSYNCMVDGSPPPSTRVVVNCDIENRTIDAKISPANPSVATSDPSNTQVDAKTTNRINVLDNICISNLINCHDGNNITLKSAIDPKAAIRIVSNDASNSISDDDDDSNGASTSTPGVVADSASTDVLTNHRIADVAVNTIDDYNNAAVRSIIEVSQNPVQEAAKDVIEEPAEENDNVFVYDGTLDSYLKSSAGSDVVAAATNPIFINTGGGLVVMPPETNPKQFYVVTNTNITDRDILAMPTVIVNDEPNRIVTTLTATQNQAAKPPPKVGNRTKKIAPKRYVPTCQAAKDFSSMNVAIANNTTTVTTGNPRELLLKTMTKSKEEPTRHAPHVRNLDFSTPSWRSGPTEMKSKAGSESKRRAWDEDLRVLTTDCGDRAPTKKKKAAVVAASRARRKNRTNAAEKEKDKQAASPIETVVKEEVGKKAEEELMPVIEAVTGQMTPVKPNNLAIPKTPEVEGTIISSSVHCTPFSEVLEEQLIGVDLISLPTPNLPITPGFSLTPGVMQGPNRRPTDYSTSSSYYQPSDTEQNKSIDQLIEECRRLENQSPQKQQTEEHPIKTDCKEKWQRFNRNVVGKKNLSLLRKQLEANGSESEASGSDGGDGNVSTQNETVIYKSRKKQGATSDDKTAAISEIIGSVIPATKTLTDKESNRKTILTQLEEVRKRTIMKIKNPPETRRYNRKKTQSLKRKPMKKSDENTDDEARKLVKGLAERGIHLVPTPQKTKPPTPTPPPPSSPPSDDYDDDSGVTFAYCTYADCESVVHEEKNKIIKQYDASVLTKSMRANVFMEDLNEEVTRIIKWTPHESLLEMKSRKRIKCDESATEIDDDLMDFALVKEKASEAKQVTTKGGKKRKSRFVDDGAVDKKSKKMGDITLLKKIDVDSFLDKLHG